MNTKSILVLAITIVWFWFGHNYYLCTVKQLCKDSEEGKELPAAKVQETTFPIAFQFQSSNALLHPDLFPPYYQQKLEGNTQSNYLIIEGQYIDGEPDTLGLARAKSVKQLFKDSINADRIFIQSMKSMGPLPDATLFEAVQIFWNDEMPATIETAEEDVERPSAEGDTVTSVKEETALKEKVSKIVSLPDRILIYHLFGSAERTTDKEVDQYLGLLSQRLQQTNEIVVLTGHTDDIGDEDANLQLGLERASFIKNMLIEKGVPEKRIVIYSKGETAPIEANTTQESRQRNRRTELLLQRQ